MSFKFFFSKKTFSMITLSTASLYLMFSFILSLSLITVAQAKQSIAKVISVKGAVFAKSNKSEKRKLKRRSKVFKEDVIFTGKNARIQLRFTDGALMALEDDAQLAISEYDYNDNDNDKVLFELFEGKLRTITGKIGKKNKKNYQMKTPVATIGIRGTHYVLNYCQSNCAKKFSGRVQQGLYGGVYDGGIWTKNSTGDTGFSKDDYFFVNSSNESPKTLLQIPEPLQPDSLLNSEKSAQQETATAKNEDATDEGMGSDSSDDSKVVEVLEAEETSFSDNQDPLGSDVTGGADVTPVTQADATTTTIVDTIVKNISGFHTSNLTNIRTAPMGIAGGVAISFINSNNVVEGVAEFVDSGINGIVSYGTFVDGPDNVIVRVEENNMTCMPRCVTKAENAVLLDDGGDALGINWGRWSGQIYVEENNNVSLVNSNMHYVNAGNVTPLASVPVTGVFTFNYAGGTKPTSETGSVGSILSGTKMVVDFGSSNINAFINVGIDGKVLNASGSSTYSGAGKANILLGGTCTGCSNGTLQVGNLQTVFVGPNAEGAAGPFSLKSSDATVSGVIFTKR